MRSSVPLAAWRVRSWPIAILIALAPLWLIGILDRGLWTPDEPREADISWRMSQELTSVPRLAEQPFLEKPPLSYWLSAAGLVAFGHPRAPNILYAGITALAVGATAAAMMDAAAAFLSALLVASTLIAFRVSVWLAPDACLLAGCALALLGAYKGYTAPPGRGKLGGYTLMHLGAAVGFMAKSAPGWLVPALALLTLIAWERKWTELLRLELYAGLLLQALIIAPWVHAVAHSPGGHDALVAILWNNTIGRFAKVAGPAALDYTTGHRNWTGKYLLELPVYLLPWTLLAIAALWRAASAVRVIGATGTPWRFAIAATVPFLVVLSLAATARDVYAAPAMLGMSLLIALWAADSQNNLRSIDRLALRGTRLLVAIIAAVFAAFLALLAVAGRVGDSDPRTPVIPAAAAVATIIVAAIALRRAARAQRLSNICSAVTCIFAAYAGALCVAALAAFPVIDRWQNLGLLADNLHYETRDQSLALLDPDETTIAMLDYRLMTPATVLDTGGGSDAARAVSSWFRLHGKQARVLVLLPGHASGGVTRLLSHIRPIAAPGDGIAGALAAQGTASIVQRFELPQGRRYALLGPPAT